MRKNIFHSEKGSVLMMALLVMAAVLATASGLSVLIINQLKASGNLDSSLQAYYAAESGIEKALWKVQDARKQGKTLAQTMTDVKEGQVVMDTARNISYTIDPSKTTTTNTDFKAYNIPMNGSIQVDLFDPDGAQLASGISTLALSWKDDCSGCTQLEFTTVSWASGGTIDIGSGRVEKFYRTFGEQGQNIPLNPANVYSLRVKNLGVAGKGRVSELTIQAKNPSGTVVTIPSRIVIWSDGDYANSRLSLKAQLPWRLPPTGFADYILFSEEALEK